MMTLKLNVLRFCDRNVAVCELNGHVKIMPDTLQVIELEAERY